MQLNIHVPRDREEVVAQLDAEAEASGRPKNQIVLDAIAAYLRPGRRHRRVAELPAWNLGITGSLRRADIYQEREDAKFGSRP